jgi:hypothetical protein
MFGLLATLATPLSGQIKMDLAMSTFIGAEAFDRAQGMTRDAAGNIYLAMNTQSANLPTTAGVVGAKYAGNQDAYLAKYSPDGKQLLWATYLGGPAEDRGYGVQLGPDNSVYLVGITKSRLFPTTPNSAGTRYHGGESDFFVAKFSSEGNLQFSTVLGGSGRDWSRGNFFVDEQGVAYVGGETDSPDFPTTSGALQLHLAGGSDGFLIKLSPDGSHIDYSTYYGGTGDEATYSGVYVSPTDKSIYFAGYTKSSDFPVTPNALQTKYGGGCDCELGDAFVARVNAEGNQAIFSTYLGGPGGDGVAKNDGLTVDAQGRVIVVGQAGAGFPVTKGASQAEFGGGLADGFVSILSADGRRLLGSTLIGGSDIEEPSGVDVDSWGNVFVSGNTMSEDYPVTNNAFQRDFRGGETDMMFTVFSPDLTEALYSTLIGGSGQGTFGDRGRSLKVVDDHLVVFSGDTDSADFPLLDARQTQFGGVADGALLEWSFLYPGDANGDLIFDSNDLIQVFAAGQYEDAIVGNSDWSTGDWNFDGDFTSGDLVTALQLNSYNAAPGARPVVPEPASGLLLLLGLGAAAAGHRARRRRSQL